MSLKESYWNSRTWSKDEDCESKRIIFMSGWNAAIENLGYIRIKELLQETIVLNESATRKYIEIALNLINNVRE